MTRNRPFFPTRPLNIHWASHSSTLMVNNKTIWLHIPHKKYEFIKSTSLDKFYCLPEIRTWPQRRAQLIIKPLRSIYSIRRKVKTVSLGNESVSMQKSRVMPLKCRYNSGTTQECCGFVVCSRERVKTRKKHSTPFMSIVNFREMYGFRKVVSIIINVDMMDCTNRVPQPCAIAVLHNVRFINGVHINV